MSQLDGEALAAWTMLKITAIVYGCLAWEIVSQFPDEIRLIFWPTVRKFVQTGRLDTHASACCLLLSRLLVIPLLAFKVLMSFVGGGDKQCTIFSQGVTVTLAVGIFNAQTILLLRTLAIVNPRLHIKCVLWFLMFGNLSAWAYSAASIKAASITTWYPSFGFVCLFVAENNYSFTATFFINLLAELIMAYFTIKTCIKALSAEHVEVHTSTVKRVQAILASRRAFDSLPRRVATSALDDSLWLFFLAVVFDIVGAIWVVICFWVERDLEKGVLIIPFKEFIVFAIVPRTIISMKRLNVVAEEGRNDTHGTEESRTVTNTPSLPHPRPFTPMFPPPTPTLHQGRQPSFSSLRRSVSSPRVAASTLLGSSSREMLGEKIETHTYYRGPHQDNEMRNMRLLDRSARLESLAAQLSISTRYDQ